MEFSLKIQRNYHALEKKGNIANKEKMADRRGLTNAYRSLSRIYKSGKAFYISGTGGKDGDIEIY